jgi:hypothetical protein
MSVPSSQQTAQQTAQPNNTPDSVSAFQMAMNSVSNELGGGQNIAGRGASTEPTAENQIPRTAMKIGPSTTNFPLVGDPPEYAAPPVPDDLTAADLVAAENLVNNSAERIPPRQQPTVRDSQATPNSVTWESKPERWNRRNQSTSSTTRQPDPRILPNPYVQQPIGRNDHLPQSNPASMKMVGDQVVGESTTMGSNRGGANQYQGLSPLPAQKSGNSTTLLPRQYSDINAEKIVANSEIQRQSESAFASAGADARQQSGDSSRGEFSSAGFNRPSSRIRNQANEAAGQGGSSNEMQRIRRGTDGSSGQTPIKRPNQNDRFRGDRQSVMSAKPRVDSTNPLDAATEMISTKRFRLNYGIDAIDPSGVAKVDLWMTRDGGRTWNSWGSDPDNASPFPVEVQEEGRYGFRIVVHSKDGLTGRGPSSGDTADMWVHVDTQSPLARITSVPYGRGDEAGRLVINYSVNDPFLVLRPITLAYSRGPSGPWTMIDEGLRNEGRYVWKPTSNVPDRIFLRIDARDTAGNVGVHQLSQAIDVSGLIPRGTIHGVTPVGN